MKLSILLLTQDFRGDHATDVGIAYDVLPGETVEHLAERLMSGYPRTDVIEIRVIQTPEVER
jgi:hypothetical protein